MVFKNSSEIQIDVRESINLIETANYYNSKQMKALLAEKINQGEGDHMLIELIDYYVKKESSRILDVIANVKELKYKIIFDKIRSLISSSYKPGHGQSSSTALELLMLLFLKNHQFLYRVVNHPLTNHLIKMAKTIDKLIAHWSPADLRTISTNQRTLTILIPYLPRSSFPVTSYTADILNGLLSQAKLLNHLKCDSESKSQLLSGTSAILSRIYGLFPRTTMAYFQSQTRDSRRHHPRHVIAQLLDGLRLHPDLLLVEGDKENQTILVEKWRVWKPEDIAVFCDSLVINNETNREHSYELGCYLRIEQGDKDSKSVILKPFKSLISLLSPSPSKSFTRPEYFDEKCGATTTPPPPKTLRLPLFRSKSADTLRCQVDGHLVAMHEVGAKRPHAWKSLQTLLNADGGKARPPEDFTAPIPPCDHVITSSAGPSHVTDKSATIVGRPVRRRSMSHLLPYIRWKRMSVDQIPESGDGWPGNFFRYVDTHAIPTTSRDNDPHGACVAMMADIEHACVMTRYQLIYERHRTRDNVTRNVGARERASLQITHENECARLKHSVETLKSNLGDLLKEKEECKKINSTRAWREKAICDAKTINELKSQIEDLRDELKNSRVELKNLLEKNTQSSLSVGSLQTRLNQANFEMHDQSCKTVYHQQLRLKVNELNRALSEITKTNCELVKKNNELELEKEAGLQNITNSQRLAEINHKIHLLDAFKLENKRLVKGIETLNNSLEYSKGESDRNQNQIQLLNDTYNSKIKILNKKYDALKAINSTLLADLALYRIRRMKKRDVPSRIFFPIMSQNGGHEARMNTPETNLLSPDSENAIIDVVGSPAQQTQRIGLIHDPARSAFCPIVPHVTPNSGVQSRAAGIHHHVTVSSCDQSRVSGHRVSASSSTFVRFLGRAGRALTRLILDTGDVPEGQVIMAPKPEVTFNKPEVHLLEKERPTFASVFSAYPDPRTSRGHHHHVTVVEERYILPGLYPAAAASSSFGGQSNGRYGNDSYDDDERVFSSPSYDGTDSSIMTLPEASESSRDASTPSPHIGTLNMAAAMDDVARKRSAT